MNKIEHNEKITSNIKCLYVASKECYSTNKPIGFIGIICLNKSHGVQNEYSTYCKEKYYRYVLGEKFMYIEIENDSRPIKVRVTNVSVKPINFRGTPVQLYKKLNYYRNRRQEELNNLYDEALYKIKKKKDLNSYEIVLRLTDKW